MILSLQDTDMETYNNFVNTKVYSLKIKHFIANSSLFPFTGVGDINTYALFTEKYLYLVFIIKII